MMFFPMRLPFCSFLPHIAIFSGAILLMGIEGSAIAQQTKPLAQKPPAEAQAPNNNEANLALARQLVIVSGMSRSFSVMIPQYMDQISTALTQTRPDLIRDLNEVMLSLKPEFDKQADEMIDLAAHIYLRLLSEQDIKTALAFYQSESGRHFVETQPVFLNELLTGMQGWQSKISTDMMTRVRVEMKKKGHNL